MKMIDAEAKDDIFRNPTADNPHFGRIASVVQVDGQTYAAAQVERGREARILAGRLLPDAPWRPAQSAPGGVHQPVLCDRGGNIDVVWNEVTTTGWMIRRARLAEGAEALAEAETVFEHEAVCLPPAVVAHDGRLYVAFAARYEGRIRIHVARQTNRGWRIARPLGTGGADRFRPRLAAHSGGLFLVFDQYRQGRYEVVLATSTDGVRWQKAAVWGEPQARWLNPRMVCDQGGAATICWVVLRPVMDKWGVVDNQPSIFGARYQDGEHTLLTDPDRADDPRIIGDLREGLLAAEIYKGHVGLRRHPQLAIEPDGHVRLFWEMRKESWDSDVIGHLVGRRCSMEGHWTRPTLLSSAGYAYTIPPRMEGMHLPVGYYDFQGTGLDVLRCATINLETDGQPLDIDTRKWRRWKITPLKPQRKPAATVKRGDGEYHLVWTDTHCHTGFSPDAEGELDELVHFARDVAGLDGVTLIDNDYYPHKALTEAEWRIHGELSAHFTQPGSFVWLPGYEFTYHRRDLNPDFNHRCILFPRPGGPLFRRIDPATATDAQMIAALKQTDGLAYPHHASYELLDDAVEWNVEVCSSWRVCIEETTPTIEKLKAGARIGFIGSSDTHRSVPGLGGARTGLFVKELTPEALFDAFRQRRIIATQGFNIFIDFQVSGAFIGESTVVDQAPRVTGDVRAWDAIDYVEVIRDGESIWWERGHGRRCTFAFTDEEVASGPHFYFLKVKLQGDPSLNVDGIPANNFPKPFEQNSRYPHNLARARGVFAWSSPVWITRNPK